MADTLVISDKMNEGDNVAINAGVGLLAVPGGSITLTAGAAPGSAAGGDVALVAGASAGAGNGGNVSLTLGLAPGAGAPGNLIIANIPTADPLVDGAIWANAGVLTVSAGA